MSDALKTWQEKREYLEQQLSITSDSNQKFTLRKQIEECDSEITRLESKPKLYPNNLSSSSNQPTTKTNSPRAKGNSMKDVFLCHASEDKPNVVRPLSQALIAANISCWLDEAEIQWGDSITKKVNDGLVNSRYVIVVLSEAFLNKNWPQRELFAVLNQEASSGEVKILPLLIGANQILQKLPLLNDKMYLTWDGQVEKIAQELRKLLTKSTTTQNLQPNSLSGKEKPLNIPIPKIKKTFSQREKDVFLKESFNFIKSYFQQGLSQLATHYKEQNVETDFLDIHSLKFISRIYVNGDINSQCKICIGNNIDPNSISYSEGRTIDINNDNTTNGWVSVEDDGFNLYLRPFLITFFSSQTKEYFTAEQAANYLWERFTNSLR